MPGYSSGWEHSFVHSAYRSFINIAILSYSKVSWYSSNFLYFFSVSGVYWWHIYVSRLLVVIMPALSFSLLFRKFSSASEINLGRYFLWERGIRSIDSLANILYIVWNYVLFTIVVWNKLNVMSVYFFLCVCVCCPCYSSSGAQNPYLPHYSDLLIYAYIETAGGLPKKASKRKSSENSTQVCVFTMCL